MPPITYNRTFSHVDWIDNEDIVQAGGEKGMNARFHAIEDEFDNVSTVVQQVSDALSSIGGQVAAPVTMTFAPVLLSYRPNMDWSAVAWSRSIAGQPLGTFAEKPGNLNEAWGVAPVYLPNGVKLKDVRALGDQTGAGNVTTELIEESRSAPYAKKSLVTVAGLGDINKQPTPVPNQPVFEGNANVYYLLVGVTGSNAQAVIRIRGFQITYLP